jgi:predicted CXXCH cytochrome family protein
MKAVQQLFKGLALAVLVVGAPALAQGKIATSRHNFSAGGTGTGTIKSTSEQGICVFCHTPHKGNSSLLLWNHEMSQNKLTWSDTQYTTGGTQLQANLNSWSGSTAKCLSCHDGTVSVGAIYWANAGKPTGNGGAGAITNTAYIIAAGGDLKGNHPVGVPVPLGKAAADAPASYAGKTTGDFAMRSGWQSFAHATGTATGGVKVFGTNGAGYASGMTDMGIECASCHDPHGTDNPYFLRVTKDNSKLCLSCHNK